MPAELTPEQRAARNAYNREYNARKRREAHERAIAEREQRWAKPVQQEGIETVSRTPERSAELSRRLMQDPLAGAEYSVELAEAEAKAKIAAATGASASEVARIRAGVPSGTYIVDHLPDDEPEEIALTQEEHLAPEPEPVVERLPETPFEIYLSMLPPETIELLDMDELRKAFDDAAHDAKEERRKQLRQQARDRAKETAREAAGLLTPEEAERKRVRERMSRRVKVTPTLPFVSDTGGVAAPSITIDGVEYQHGQQATMPMGRALDIRHILYCLQQNELDFEGKGRLHGLRRQQHEATNMVRI